MLFRSFSKNTCKMQTGQYGNCKEGKMEDKNNRIFDESGSAINVKRMIKNRIGNTYFVTLPIYLKIVSY